MSIWKQDADEVLDRLAVGYFRWMAKHRWLFPVLALAVVLEVILFWVFAGLGWARLGPVRHRLDDRSSARRFHHAKAFAYRLNRVARPGQCAGMSPER